MWCADHGYPIDHLPTQFRAVEQEREQRQVVGMHLGRRDLRAVQPEPPERVRRIPSVDEQPPVPRQVSEVGSAAEPPVDLGERLFGGDAVRQQVGQHDESHLAIRSALQPMFVRGADLLVPFQEAVVAQRERPGPALFVGVDERLRVGELNRRQPVRPPKMNEEPGGPHFGHRCGAIRVLFEAGWMAVAPNGHPPLGVFVQPCHAPAVAADAHAFEASSPGLDPAEWLRMLPGHRQQLAHAYDPPPAASDSNRVRSNSFGSI
jgi:hypothetical protein